MLPSSGALLLLLLGVNRDERLIINAWIAIKSIILFLLSTVRKLNLRMEKMVFLRRTVLQQVNNNMNSSCQYGYN